MNNRLYNILMKCGHSANSTKQIAVDDEIPYCVICDCEEIVGEVDTFVTQGRKAKCCYYCSCHNIVDSEPGLPFFKMQPDQEYDSYYCGCEGWD